MSVCPGVSGDGPDRFVWPSLSQPRKLFLRKASCPAHNRKRDRTLDDDRKRRRAIRRARNRRHRVRLRAGKIVAPVSLAPNAVGRRQVRGRGHNGVHPRVLKVPTAGARSSTSGAMRVFASRVSMVTGPVPCWRGRFSLPDRGSRRFCPFGANRKPFGARLAAHCVGRRPGAPRKPNE